MEYYIWKKHWWSPGDKGLVSPLNIPLRNFGSLQHHPGAPGNMRTSLRVLYPHWSHACFCSATTWERWADCHWDISPSTSPFPKIFLEIKAQMDFRLLPNLLASPLPASLRWKPCRGRGQIKELSQALLTTCSLMTEYLSDYDIIIMARVENWLFYPHI